MISTTKCKWILLKYRIFFRYPERFIEPRIVGHVRQLDEAVRQVNLLLADATENLEAAVRLYNETSAQYQKQDVHYPDIYGKKLDMVIDKLEFQMTYCEEIKAIREKMENYLDQAMRIGGFTPASSVTK